MNESIAVPVLNQVIVPHSEMNYDERYHIDHFKGFDWKNPKKADGSPMSPEELKSTAVHFARANGFKETGMSVNEIALLYDALEYRKPRQIVELGRNFMCSSRLFIQHTIRHNASFQSWDLKQWDGALEGLEGIGYHFQTKEVRPSPVDEYQKQYNDYGPLKIGEEVFNVNLLCRDSVKSDIKSPYNDDRFVDFLLIDTEHGLEHALGEYMRWRNFLSSGAMIAFHDSTLPGPERAIELIKEIEWKACGERISREWVNERVDGYGIHILEWKG